MNNPFAKACGQAGWPLCRAYSFVLVESLTTEVYVEEGDSSGAKRKFHWALGVLPNGEYEVLGGWSESSVPGVFWEQFFDDLKARGVERIRFVVASGPAMDELAMLAAFPEAMFLAPITEMSRLSFGEADRQGGQGPIQSPTATNIRLAPTAGDADAGHLLGDSTAGHEDGSSAAPKALDRTVSRAAVRSFLHAQNAAQTMQGLVCRAVQRHGAFARPADAAAFVLEALYRAEKKTRATGVPMHRAAQNQTGAVGRRAKQRRAAVPAL